MKPAAAIEPVRAATKALGIDRTGVRFESFSELWAWSQGVAKSALIPSSFRGQPHDIMVAVQMGMEIGLRPMTALQNMAVIKGRPSLYGEIVLGLVRGAGVFDEAAYAETVARDDKGAPLGVVVTMARVGGRPYTSAFSVEDAKQAGLWMSGDGWKKYPTDMLLWKARHRCIRALFSDVTHGLGIREADEGDAGGEPAGAVQVEQVSALDDLVARFGATRTTAREVEYDAETGEVLETTPEREPGEEG